MARINTRNDTMGISLKVKIEIAVHILKEITEWILGIPPEMEKFFSTKNFRIREREVIITRAAKVKYQGEFLMFSNMFLHPDGKYFTKIR